jgi:hypothetical protein
VEYVRATERGSNYLLVSEKLQCKLEDHWEL